VVEGFLIGLHRSPHRGFSVEFAEHRAYAPGDDVRFLDWRRYARSDRWYVKQFEEETNLRATLVVDASASMGWCSDRARVVPKIDYARMLAAALAHLLLRQGDATGLAVFADSTTRAVEPRATRRHLGPILTALDATEPGGGSAAADALRGIALRLRRRGLVILLSDLLVDEEEAIRALHHLRHRGHEVLVFHLMDPGERELPPAGDAVFFDPESGEELRASSAALRAEYAAAVDAAVRRWRRACRGMGADYHLFPTDAPLGPALGRFLEKRARLG
jgi:uncharacterized protein (DUF58 family)